MVNGRTTSAPLPESTVSELLKHRLGPGRPVLLDYSRPDPEVTGSGQEQPLNTAYSRSGRVQEITSLTTYESNS